MWNKTSHDFGDQPEGQFLETDFRYSGNKQVRNIIPSCDCTTHKIVDLVALKSINSQNSIPCKGLFVIVVVWKTKVKRRERDISTDLTIEYTDGSIDILELKAHVITNNS